MNKKTYFIILILIIAATYLAYVAAFGGRTQNNPGKTISNNNSTKTTIPVYQASLSLVPNPINLPVTGFSNGSVNIVLDTANEKASGVQVELSYDPKIISNVAITPGSFIQNPVELIKEIDQKNGRISYAIGMSPTGNQAQGKGTVATITFSANPGIAKSTQLSFLPKTLVTERSVSTSILKSTSGTSIFFGQTSQPSIPTTSSGSAQ